MLFTSTRGLLDHPDAYPPFLARLCCISQSFIPLLQTALARARATADKDQVAMLLAPYLEKHIADESGEDMMADLEVLGWTRPQILLAMPTPSIAALTGSQYYWVIHCHPVAVLGYIQVLEGYPPSKDLIEALIARAGLPRSAFRSLLEHAVLDVSHRDELHALLDTLPLDDDLTALLGLSAIRTIHLLRVSFDDVFEARIKARTT